MFRTNERALTKPDPNGWARARFSGWLIPFAFLALVACQDTLEPALREGAGFASILFIEQKPPVNASGSWLFPHVFQRGGNLLLLDPAAPGADPIDLTKLAAGDVQGFDVSPQGDAVVASIATSEADRYHLVVLELGQVRRGEGCYTPGGDLGPACRQLTFGPADDTDPFYLPDGRIGFFRSDPDGPVDFQGRGRAKVLMAVLPDGTSPRVLDVDPGHVLGAGVLRSGWILAQRWTEKDHRPVFLPVLVDATGHEGLRLDGPALGMFEGEGIPLWPTQDIRGEVMATCTAPSRTWGAGTICRRDASGRWPGILGQIPMGDGCSPNGRVRDALSLADGSFLLAYAKTPEGCMNAVDEWLGQVPDFGLAVLDPTSGKRYPLYNRPSMAEIHPRPVTSRNLLGAGISLPDRPDATCQQRGLVFEGLLDADTLAAGGVRVRVLQYRSGALAPWTMELGTDDFEIGAVCGGDNNGDMMADAFEAPVSADGSYRFRVPSGVAVRLQVLDHYGAALSTDPIWRNGPSCAVRRCNGCHANDGQLAGFQDTIAAQSDPFLLDAPEAQQRSWDFRRDLQPIWERSCLSVGCHDARTHAGAYVSLDGRLLGLDLSSTSAGRVTTAYQHLLLRDQQRNNENGAILRERPVYVAPGRSSDSRLAQRLGAPCRFNCDGLSAYAPWGSTAGKRHPEDVSGSSLSDEDRMRILEWIDSGAPFFGAGGQQP